MLLPLPPLLPAPPAAALLRPLLLARQHDDVAVPQVQHRRRVVRRQRERVPSARRVFEAAGPGGSAEALRRGKPGR